MEINYIGKIIKLFTVIKILDVGFDKGINDFNKEINIVAKKIMATIASKNIADNEFDDNIMDNDFYLPINSMRNYLKPNYTEFKILYKEDLRSEQPNSLNIFETYINNFKEVVNRYFKFFLTKSKDEFIEKNLVTMRKNFFQSFRITVYLGLIKVGNFKLQLELLLF